MRTVADIFLDSIIVCQVRDQALQQAKIKSLQLPTVDEPAPGGQQGERKKNKHCGPYRFRHAVRAFWIRERGSILFILFWLGVIAFAVAL